MLKRQPLSLLSYIRTTCLGLAQVHSIFHTILSIMVASLCSFHIPLLCLTLTVAAVAPAFANDPICQPGEIVNSGKCELCPPGTFVSRRNRSKCSKCPPGTFQPVAGAVDNEICRACPPGSFAPSGSPSCTLCPPGTSSMSGFSQCIACGPGLRPREKNRKEGPNCVRCMRGTYSSGTANMKCTKCPRYHTSLPGAKGPDECKPCLRHTKCFNCRRNRFRPAWNMECVRCPSGTYTKNRKAESDADCLPCPAGTFRTLFGDRCKPCSVGKAFGPGATRCRLEGEKCPLSSFETDAGDCKMCDDGFRFDAMKKDCVRCPPGTVANKGVQTECRTCFRNQVVARGNRKCVCLPGRFLRRTTCVRCPIGTANNFIFNRERECSPCTRGIAPRRGMRKCEKCPPGQTAINGTTCGNPCAAGTVLSFLDLGNPELKCVDARTGCPPGYLKRSVGAIDCVRNACTEGSPPEDVGVKCQPCQKGFYARKGFLRGEEDKFICEECPYDETSDGGIGAVCRKCPRNSARDSDSGECECKFEAAMVNGECVRCEDGKEPNDDKVGCRACPAGTFSNQEYPFCSKCQKRTFSKEGASVCSTCPVGGVLDKAIGATRCDI